MFDSNNLPVQSRGFRPFLFIFLLVSISEKYGYAAATYTLADWRIEKAMDRRDKLMAEYKRCLDSGRWVYRAEEEIVEV